MAKKSVRNPEETAVENESVENVENTEETAAPVSSPKAKSEAYKNFEKLIEVYKKQNPEKYEKKKKELAEKLAALA